MSVNPAPEYHKSLPGFSGVKRGSNAAQQIQGSDRPSKAGSASSKTAADNASFDRSPYQSMLQKSMVGGHLK